MRLKHRPYPRKQSLLDLLGLTAKVRIAVFPRMTSMSIGDRGALTAVAVSVLRNPQNLQVSETRRRGGDHARLIESARIGMSHFLVPTAPVGTKITKAILAKAEHKAEFQTSRVQKLGHPVGHCDLQAVRVPTMPAWSSSAASRWLDPGVLRVLPRGRQAVARVAKVGDLRQLEMQLGRASAPRKWQLLRRAAKSGALRRIPMQALRAGGPRTSVVA
mmetsp:Transcript_79515/g.157532  ORF Transcript_79515/g.157532 Transcript_79515/m.157532 type:complete len:217 (-) Transcript_79515:1610-2260(-)